MIDRMVEFVHILRSSGMRVSMTEAMDAAEILRHTSIANRNMVKLGLQSALIKEQHDLHTFGELFDKFFMIHLNDPEMNEAPDSDESESVQEEHNPNGEKDEGEGVNEVSHEEGSRENASPAQEKDEQDDTEPDDEDQAASEVEALIARIQVGENTTQALAQPGQQARRTGVEDVDLYQELPPGQVENLYNAVEDLASNLVTRRSLRYRQARYGQVDIKRTIQKSFRTGNIPFHIIRKRRKINKHELVVLCDISGSVWEVARFFLKLVQEMQNQFSRARSFLFVDRMNEVTDLFDNRPFDEIIEEFKDNPTLNFFGLSDFGRAFYQFYTEDLKTLCRDTVLVILGDARANWFDPLEWTLDEMQRRTHLVIWLNPEPRQYWDTDDSVISKYSPFCDHVLECRNLEQLKQIGELILQS